MKEDNEEQIITFDTAKLAKDKGFNDHFFHRKGEDSSRWWKCEYCYDPNDDTKEKQRWGENITNSTNERLERLVSAPTQSLLQKWLRKIHQIDVTVIWFERGYLYSTKKRPYKGNNYKIEFNDSHEKAFEIGLVEGLKLIK